MTVDFKLTPDVVIRDVHTLAEELDFTRVRVDRSAYQDDPNIWIEVGYGCGEITIRTSQDHVRYRCAVDRVDMEDVIDLFESLMDCYPEGEPQ